MQYKKLGKSGLKVSALCLGTMTFGDGADEAMSRKIFDYSREKGINFFDCADVYADGESERILGRLVKGQRDKVVLATKAYFPTGKDVNSKGTSRYHLVRALEMSLSRLDTDYVDIYYLHRFDPDTPLEESLYTLNNFVQQGKVLYIGLSNFAAWQVMKAIGVSNQNYFAGITCIQPMYNLLKRQSESELLPMAQSEGLGVLSYSPLAGGYLTGKYLAKPMDNSKGRFDDNVMYQKRYKQASYRETLKRFTVFARENSYHPASLALAWVASHPAITAPLIGATTTDQLESALASLDIPMTGAMRTAISAMSPAPALATDRSEEADT